MSHVLLGAGLLVGLAPYGLSLSSAVAAQPSSVTAEATKPIDSQAVPTRHSEVEAEGGIVWLAPGQPARTRTLFSGTGDSIPAELELRPTAEAAPIGQKAYEITVAADARPGSYSGLLILPDGDKLAVTLRVRDHWIFLFLAVGLGSWLGAVLTRRLSVMRRRTALRVRVKKTIEHYEAAQESRPSPDHHAQLSLPASTELPKTSTDEVADPVSDCATLYGRIGRARSEAELSLLGDQVDELVVAVDSWRHLDTEMLRLHSTVKDVDRVSNILIHEDVDRILAAAGSVTDPEQAKAACRQLERVVNAAAAYAALWMVWAELPGTERNEGLLRCEPARIYRELRSDPPATYPFNSRLIRRLDKARRTVLARLQEIDHDRPTMDLSVSAFVEFGDQLSMLALSLTRSITLPQTDGRSSHDILAGYRRWSLVVAAFTAVVTALAYVAGAYDATFGSPQQYLGAILGAFIAQIGAFSLNLGDLGADATPRRQAASSQ